MRSITQRRTQATQQNRGLSGDQVVQKEVVTTEKEDGAAQAASLIGVLYGVIAAFLGLAFIFRLAGANRSNGFVSFIYSVSNFLSAPFDGIFNVSRVQTGTVSSVFEPSLLVALVIYGLIAWGLIALLRSKNETV